MPGLEFRTFFVNLLFTLVIQFVPVLLYRYIIRKKPSSPKRAKKIAILYEMGEAIFSVLLLLLLTALLPQSASGIILEGATISFAPFLLYGYFIYRIMKSDYVDPILPLEEINQPVDPFRDDCARREGPILLSAPTEEETASERDHAVPVPESESRNTTDVPPISGVPSQDTELKKLKTQLQCLIAVLILLVVTGAALALTGTFTTRSQADAQAQESYQLGLEAGTEEGKELGYSTGLSDGYKQGESEGYKSGEKSGKTAGYREASEEYQNKVSILMNKLKTPYPETGKIFFASTEDRYAPLEIHNPTDDAYFFKAFSDDGETKKDALTFFIAPQSTAELAMPLGNYRIKYAIGSGDWYGEKMLFGENTRTEIFTDFFSFTVDDSSYWGHTITLQTSLEGNLGSELLGLDEF